LPPLFLPATLNPVVQQRGRRMRGTEAVTDLIHDTAAAIESHHDLGRFLQRDPIGIWGDPGNYGNGYAYVGGDPENGRDPSGEKFICDIQRSKKSCETKPFTDLDGLCDILNGRIGYYIDTIVQKVIPAIGLKDINRIRTWAEIANTLLYKDIKIHFCPCKEYDKAKKCSACDQKMPGMFPVAWATHEGNEIELCCDSLSGPQFYLDEVLIHEISHTMQNTMATTDLWREWNDAKNNKEKFNDWLNKNAGSSSDASSYSTDWRSARDGKKVSWEDYKRDLSAYIPKGSR
jgi:hypothetical protein